MYEANDFKNGDIADWLYLFFALLLMLHGHYLWSSQFIESSKRHASLVKLQDIN